MYGKYILNEAAMDHPRPNPQDAAKPAHDAPTDAQIAALVTAFYGRVRAHPTLGPLFERDLAGRWDGHLTKMLDFWSSVMGASGRYKGTPMAVHQRMVDLDEAHFAIWLTLFRCSVEELFDDPQASAFITKAEMIARSLRYGIEQARNKSPIPAFAADHPS